MSDDSDESYDVLVVGGGAAGLSGALALVRSRRSVLVVDAGAPRNAPAAGVHNFLTRDGTPPAELLAAGRAEVAGYGGSFRAGTAVAARASGGGFRVAIDDGTGVRAEVSARRLLVTTGVVDELPDVPGLAERWGRDVVHCPYCHGWEWRDRAVGVLATSPAAIHQAMIWRQLTGDLTVVGHGFSVPDDDRARLSARGVRFVDGPVTGLEVDHDALTGLRLASGEVVGVEACAVASRAVAGSAFLSSLGLEPVEVEQAGVVLGTAVPADPTGATAVTGVWVAGNVANPMAQVVTSAGAGLMAGAVINADLAAEELSAAQGR